MSDTRDNRPAHEAYRDDLAAYALGALEEGEAAELRRHLEGCEECREHLRWLQPAVDVLPRTVPQVEPPSSLRKRVMGTVRAESRDARHVARADAQRSRGRGWGALLMRPATVVAAAALVVVVGALGGYLLHSPNHRSSVVAARPTTAAPAASGTLERQGGVAILHVEGMPALAGNQVYETWVKRGDKVEPSSVFSLRRNRSGDAAIPGPLEGADAVLVTREPSGGSPQPTSPPVLEATLD